MRLRLNIAAPTAAGAVGGSDKGTFLGNVSRVDGSTFSEAMGKKKAVNTSERSAQSVGQ